jgi:hypothetical protein
MRVLIIIAFLTNSLFSQNLDSLYNLLISLREYQNGKYSAVQSGSFHEEKCGFGLSATVMEHYDEFTPSQQMKISEVMQRPELETSIVSPSGIFRIHFDESGINKPEYSINDLAAAFDSAYSFEVNYLGYPPPPGDNNLGGDDKFDVYVRNLNGGLYGVTTPEVSIGDGKSITYIEIDNSFGKNEGYNSFGINAARVTAAHEFHHAIQLGNYVFRSDDKYYYELTSTAFEEFVYDEVNDYYAYISSYFRNTDNRLQNNNGYNLALWNIFLQEYFNEQDPTLGHRIVKKSWENIIANRAIVALANAIQAETSLSFSQLLNEFGNWIYFTGERSKKDQFFEEAEFYPLLRSNLTLELDNTRLIGFSSEPTSINYITFYDYSSGFTDTVASVISNSNVIGSLSNGNSQFVDLTLSNVLLEDGSMITDQYFYKLESDPVNFIQSSYIINNDPSGLSIKREEVDFVYPQPFNYFLGGVLNLPTYPDVSEIADLYIYSSDMNLVYNGKKEINTNGNIVVEWNGLDNNGNRLGGGVYIYVTKANGKIKKGKFVILN